ncbi:MAG: RlmE family RNA methyltransferase [Bdellovibrionales bacterium]|nr:RlmE family RNA methyltransferase [Bdellovibrionales bacterium]
MAHYNSKDHYFHKAKKEGFVARSAYKLQEIQQKYKIIRPGDRVLDLGCSPGSWSQVAAKIIGENGFLTGIDLKPVTISSTKRTQFIVGDILNLDLKEMGPFSVILSDMAPSTSGIKSRDQALSEELCYTVLSIAKRRLDKGGNLVMKLFEGPESEQVAKQTKDLFAKVQRYKPLAVRKGSYETYIIGTSFNFNY